MADRCGDEECGAESADLNAHAPAADPNQFGLVVQVGLDGSFLQTHFTYAL